MKDEPPHPLGAWGTPIELEVRRPLAHDDFVKALFEGLGGEALKGWRGHGVFGSWSRKRGQS